MSQIFITLIALFTLIGLSYLIHFVLKIISLSEDERERW